MSEVKAVVIGITIIVYLVALEILSRYVQRKNPLLCIDASRRL